MSDTYTPDDWPHGLRCTDCHDEFTEGQPISERLTATTTMGDGEPAFIVEIVCVPCGMGLTDRAT